MSNAYQEVDSVLYQRKYAMGLAQEHDRQLIDSAVLVHQLWSNGFQDNLLKLYDRLHTILPDWHL
jgi:hypothetical protein